MEQRRMLRLLFNAPSTLLDRSHFNFNFHARVHQVGRNHHRRGAQGIGHGKTQSRQRKSLRQTSNTQMHDEQIGDIAAR
jgi:hypothetical protein